MKKRMTPARATSILKKEAPSEEMMNIIYSHSKNVADLSLKIAMKIPDTDIHFIKTAALLHDIGRFKHPPEKSGIRHGIEGGKILRKAGFPRHARAAERHVGVGITKQDIIKQKLNLPKKDFIPLTVEEKIIAYADNFFEGSKKRNINYVIERFRKELGESYVKRFIKLHDELEKLKKNK